MAIISYEKYEKKGGQFGEMKRMPLLWRGNK